MSSTPMSPGRPGRAARANTRMSRRRALQLFAGGALGAAALSSAGCTITRGEPPITSVGLDKKPAKGRKENIEIYHPWGAPTGAGLVQLAEEFEAAQPDIGVRMVYAPAGVGGGAVQQKLFTAIAGNNPPDVAMLVPMQTAQWAELGIMTDLTDWFDAAGLKEEDFFAPAWESMYYRGRVWQLQWDADPNFPFFWNKGLFEESGLDPDKPPETIDELTEFSKQILKKDGANVTKVGTIPWDTYGGSNSIFTYGFAFGGDFYDKERDVVTPDHELVVDALEWMVQYAKDIGGADRIAVVPPGLAFHRLSSGNVGMDPLVAPNYRDILNNVKDIELGTALLPYQPPGAERLGAGAWFGGWSAFIPSKSQHKEAAWEFIRWISATPEGTKKQYELVGFPPALQTAPVLQEIKDDPIMAPYYDVLVTATKARPTMGVSDFYFQKLDEQMELAIFGEVSAIEALRVTKEDTMGELRRFRQEVVQP